MKQLSLRHARTGLARVLRSLDESGELLLVDDDDQPRARLLSPGGQTRLEQQNAALRQQLERTRRQLDEARAQSARWAAEASRGRWPE